jgi:hypothetical protein
VGVTTALEVASRQLQTDDRTNRLLAQGIPLNVMQIENHYIVGLLEKLLGPDEATEVLDWHLDWVNNHFDKVEAQMRERMLTSGLFDQ